MTFKQLGNFFYKIWCHLLILCIIYIIFRHEISPTNYNLISNVGIDGAMFKHHIICRRSAEYALMFFQTIHGLSEHYDDVIMAAIASLITSLTIVYSTVYSDADQRKHQSSESLAFVLGIHRGPVNSPHKWPVTRKMFPFDDVIMSIVEINVASADAWFATVVSRACLGTSNHW